MVRSRHTREHIVLREIDPITIMDNGTNRPEGRERYKLIGGIADKGLGILLIAGHGAGKSREDKDEGHAKNHENHANLRWKPTFCRKVSYKTEYS